MLGGTYTSEGITAIADAMRISTSLTSINLKDNSLGSESTNALAPAIRDSASLTRIDLRTCSNDWKPEDVAVLSKTIEGRAGPGFELLL